MRNISLLRFQLIVDNERISLLPGVRAPDIHPVCVTAKRVPCLVSGYTHPALFFVKLLSEPVIRKPCLKAQQIFNLIICHLDDRCSDLLLGDPVQKQVFFLICQFFLFNPCPGIEDLVQVNILRDIVRGQQKTVAAVFIQIFLQGLKCLCVTAGDLALDRTGGIVLFCRLSAGQC